MGLCDKIANGFDICASDAIAAGIEDLLYIFNKGDFTFTFDPANPLLITGITRVGTAKMYKFTGSSNSFDTISTQTPTNVGPRYTEEIDFNEAGLSSAIKAVNQQMGFGRVQVITINNYRDDDSVFELWGATNGLMVTEAKRTAADETYEGGYSVKLGNPTKLKEPYAPRCVNIPPGSGSATFASTLAAIEALCIPAA